MGGAPGARCLGSAFDPAAPAPAVPTHHRSACAPSAGAQARRQAGVHFWWRAASSVGGTGARCQPGRRARAGGRRRARGGRRSRQQGRAAAQEQMGLEQRWRTRREAAPPACHEWALGRTRPPGAKPPPLSLQPCVCLTRPPPHPPHACAGLTDGRRIGREALLLHKKKRG